VITHYAIWFINKDTNTLVSGATGLTTASYTHGSPLDGNYRIWGRAYNVAGSSGWSSPFDFAVAIPPLMGSSPGRRGHHQPRRYQRLQRRTDRQSCQGQNRRRAAAGPVLTVE
jgi:hypothetical protein